MTGAQFVAKAMVIVIVISALVSAVAVEALGRVSVVYGTGTVKFLGFEGGFYGIVGDDERSYDPVDLPDEFRMDGLRVRFLVRRLQGFMSHHMWGSLVSVLHIERLA